MKFRKEIPQTQLGFDKKVIFMKTVSKKSEQIFLRRFHCFEIFDTFQKKENVKKSNRILQKFF